MAMIGGIEVVRVNWVAIVAVCRRGGCHDDGIVQRRMLARWDVGDVG